MQCIYRNSLFSSLLVDVDVVPIYVHLLSSLVYAFEESRLHRLHCLLLFCCVFCRSVFPLPENKTRIVHQRRIHTHKMTDNTPLTPATLRVVDLRAELQKRGLSSAGLKNALVERLENALSTVWTYISTISNRQRQTHSNNKCNVRNQLTDFYIDEKQRRRRTNICTTTKSRGNGKTQFPISTR